MLFWQRLKGCLIVFDGEPKAGLALFLGWLYPGLKKPSGRHRQPAYFLFGIRLQRVLAIVVVCSQGCLVLPHLPCDHLCLDNLHKRDGLVVGRNCFQLAEIFDGFSHKVHAVWNALMPHHVPFHAIDALGWAFKADGPAKHTTIKFWAVRRSSRCHGRPTPRALTPLLLGAAAQNSLNDGHIKARKVTALVHLGARGNSKGSGCHDDPLGRPVR